MLSMALIDNDRLKEKETLAMIYICVLKVQQLIDKYLPLCLMNC